MTKYTSYEASLIIGAPLTLGLVELFHPHLHDFMTLDLSAWMFVHYAQIPLFPLAALGVVTLIRSSSGAAASICRIAMFTFAISYVAFDTAAGLVTGILASAAQHSHVPAPWLASINLIWTHPVVGANSSTPLLAMLGGYALPVGVIAAAVSLRRAGASFVPLALLVIASLGLVIFHSHAPPGGPFTFCGIAVASAWLVWERARQHRTQHGTDASAV